MRGYRYLHEAKNFSDFLQIARFTSITLAHKSIQLNLVQRMTEADLGVSTQITSFMQLAQIFFEYIDKSVKKTQLIIVARDISMLDQRISRMLNLAKCLGFDTLIQFDATNFTNDLKKAKEGAQILIGTPWCVLFYLS